MLIWENVKLAFIGICNNKMRAFLTMLGIIIGIGSVIAIMTVSSSLTSSITQTFVKMGANNITVGLQKQSEEEETRRNGMKFGVSRRQAELGEEDRITDEMIEDVKREYSAEIGAISLEEALGSGTVQFGTDTANVSISGINRGYYDANDTKLVSGRYLSEADVTGNKSVIMISDKAVEKIFGGDIQEALGQKITIEIGAMNYSFYVVGVYEYETDISLFSSESEDDVITMAYIPITTGKEMVHSDTGYEQFTIVTDSQVESVADFATEIKAYINRKYYMGNEEYQINTVTMSSMTNSMSNMIQTVSIAIAFIAGISLLVGGIGVMNIMLVSITERTREIGMRKALGARNSSIRFQFIVESMILCLIGGILGIIVGLLLGAVAVSMLGYSAVAPMVAIVGAVIFSMIIGVFFGYYPANKAAKMNPIEALRYE